MPSTLEDSERLRRSFWKRKLQAFYVLFDEIGSTVTDQQDPSSQVVVPPTPPPKGEQWMRHEACVEEALDHFEPFYGDMWDHLQGILGAKLPPIQEDDAALVREATRLLNADYPEEKGVDAVVAAVEHCRRQEAARSRAYSSKGAGGGLSDDRRRQERQELARTLRHVPLWARGALMGGISLDADTTPSPSLTKASPPQPVLLSSVVLLRCLFRRKLEAYYSLVDDTKGLGDVDECMMHFLNNQRKQQQQQQSPSAADSSSQTSPVVGNRKVYDAMVHTWMEQHNRALVAPGVEVRNEDVEDDKKRFLIEVEAFYNMWVRLQGVYAFYVPSVEVSPRTFNEEISRVLFRLPPPPPTSTLSLSPPNRHHHVAAPTPSGPPQRHLTTPVYDLPQSPPERSGQSPRDSPRSAVVTFGQPPNTSTTDRSQNTHRSQPPRSSTEAAALYKNLDIAALDTLPTAAFVADYHYKRRLAKGSISQTTKVSVVVSGIPFRAYKQLSGPERARVNECLVMDMSALMSQQDESGAAAKVAKTSKLQSHGSSSSLLLDSSLRSGGLGSSNNLKGLVRSPMSADSRNQSFRGRSNTNASGEENAIQYEYFDAKSVAEERRNQKDGIASDADQRAFASPKSPFAPIHGGRLINHTTGAYGANVVILPIDTTITSVQYHVPSQGLEVTLLMTPTPDSSTGSSGGGLNKMHVEERLHMDYLPRLMKKVLRSNSGVGTGPDGQLLPPSADGNIGGAATNILGGGAILTLTEEVCVPLGITLQQCPSGIYHSVPRLVDVRISIQTSLNRTT